jgi:capsular polysaccharide biosynthesis protein
MDLVAAEEIGVADVAAKQVDPNAVQLFGSEQIVARPAVFLGPDLAALLDGDARWSTTYRSPPVLAACLTNARVLGKLFTVVMPDGSALRESLYLSSLEEVSARAKQNLQSSRSEQPAFLLANRVYDNYYHWTLQCLPSLSVFQSLFERGACKLVTGPLSEWRRRTLQLAGFDASDLEIVEDGEIRSFGSLTYPTPLAGGGGFRPWRELRPFFQALKQRAEIAPPGHPMIYLSRRDSSRRPLVNDSELAERLAELGFRTLVMSDMTIDEQISAFAGAKVIVAPHGAGVSNIVYCEPETILYELLPAHYPNPCFFRLSQVFDLSYWADCFPACGTSVNRADRHRAPWAVDAEMVISRVKTILAGLDAP